MKRPFAPSFLNNLDHDLLLHRPDTWSTRIHLVLYYGLLFMLLLAGICFLVPFDPGNSGELEVWIVLLSVVAFIAFIFWLIYLLRFNVFKRYGQLGPGDSVKTFILFFICIGTFVLIPYVPPYVESVRANSKFGDEEVVKDLNSINTKILQLEYDILDRTWDADTIRVINKYSEHVIDYNNNVATVAGSRYEVNDTASFRVRLREADSVVKINDSFYVFFTCPNYRIIDPYNADRYTRTNFLLSTDLYYSVVENYVRPDLTKVRAELLALLDKYDPDRENYSYGSYSVQPTYLEKINKKYNLYDTERRFGNLIRKKYRWRDDDIQIIFRVFYYVTLFLSLLVFIFRHTTVRTFFLALLSAFVLTLLTTMFMAMARGGIDNPTLIILVYYGLFALIAFAGLASRTRNVVTGIALNKFVFCTPFIPLIATAYYYWELHNSATTDPKDPLYDPDLFNNEEIHYLYAELGGLILLLILIELVFKKLYRNWYAKPEQ